MHNKIATSEWMVRKQLQALAHCSWSNWSDQKGEGKKKEGGMQRQRLKT